MSNLDGKGSPSIPTTLPRTDTADTPWPVAIFAHDEAANIIQCLESISNAHTTHPIQAYVMTNGCSDSTEKIVHSFAAFHPWVTLVSVVLGDKANAWNMFVHDIAPQAQIYFFLDGDVQVIPHSFDALYSALCTMPKANGAAAVPFTGRSRKWLEKLVCEERLLLGNFYALRGEFVWRMRSEGIRLPVGMFGEDGLVTSLVKWNLDPTGPFLHERISPCPAAGFSYRSLSPWQLRDWRKYRSRRMRYSIRYFQHEILVPLLTGAGIRGMPATVDELYRKQLETLKNCRPRTGLDLVFDRIAIQRMQRNIH